MIYARKSVLCHSEAMSELVGTIIERTNGGWIITERRVAYDVENTVNCLKASGLYEQAEIWSRIMIKQLKTGGDFISHYLRHVEELAKKLEYPSFPVSNEIWQEAANTFEMVNIRSEG